MLEPFQIAQIDERDPLITNIIFSKIICGQVGHKRSSTIWKDRFFQYLNLVFVDERAGDEVQVIGGDNLQCLKDKQVIVIEDIVDTGNTMRKLMNVLVKYEPKIVKGLLKTRRRRKLHKLSTNRFTWSKSRDKLAIF